MPSHATAVVDLTDPPDRLDLGAADVWHLLLTVDGVPRSELVLPGTGGVVEGELLRAAVLAHGDALLAERATIQRLRKRLGETEPSFPSRSCSVVVCTHRRPAYVPHVLAALGRLDPAPDEIIIVDNAPGDLDCRAQVEAAGARYVREDRKGLDRARVAGLGAARCELVAFTDDDCVPSPAWLQALPELFDDPAVAAVTGPAFAHSLATAAQRQFEASGGFRRGWARRSFDVTTLRPTAAGQIGAGANMIFRRSVLDALGDVFPPELDAGTPTESGGDMYALYKVLAAGHRAVYDPGTYVLHQHRPDSRWMHRTFWGYGVGLSAVLTKVMVEQRELAAPAVWWWLWRQYREVVVRGLMGDAQPVAVRIGWDYLRGGLMGAAAWRAARRQLPASERRPAPGRASSPALRVPRSVANAGEATAVSVIVPTVGRPGAVERCLAALARERADGVPFEVVLVDDAPTGAADGTAVAPPAPTWVRSIRTGGAGAAAARNAGAAAARADLLLFLDDDLVPEPGLVRHHIERHRAAAAGRIVIGYSPPRPALRTLAALGAALWWEDHYRGKRDAGAMTFVEALSGNMSISRTTWERLGAFDVDFGRLRREDWEWGIRALQAGTEIVYAPEAVAAHEFTFTTQAKLAHARDEGAGDALLLERYPAALPSLPAAGWPRELAYGRRAPALLLLRSARLRRAMVPVLDALEWARARQLWQRLFLLAYVAAYDAGFRAGGGRRGASPALLVELASDEPLPPPAVVAPIIEVRLRGRRVGGFRPEEGRWSGALAQRIAGAVPRVAWNAMAQAGPDRGGDPQLTGLTVLLGPARRPGDDRHALALEAAGADVRRLDGPRDAHWAEIARAARAAPAAAIVVSMPGVALSPERLAPALPALAADRVDALVVIARSWLRRPSPLYLASAAVGSRPYAVPDAPPDYVLLAAGRCAALGESVASLEELGSAAPVLELLQRILDGGGVVATRDVPAAPGSAASLRRRRWDLHRSRASLFAWRATSIGPVHGALWGLRFSAAPVAAALVRSAKYGEPRPSAALGRAAAFVAGTARAASVGRRRRRGHRGGRRPELGQPPAADATRQWWGGRNTPPSEESPSTVSG